MRAASIKCALIYRKKSNVIIFSRFIAYLCNFTRPAVSLKMTSKWIMLRVWSTDVVYIDVCEACR